MRVYLVAAPAVLLLGFAPAPFPKQPKPGTGLYTDVEVERLAGKQLQPDEATLLDVVPAGETKPRQVVFQALGLNESRLRDRRSAPDDHVVFLYWRASPSYDLSFMTATKGPANKGLDVFDPNRQVYGVRIERRSKTPR
jgi:hypothetical protein